MLDLDDVISSVKDHLINKGYEVSDKPDKNGITAEILATKGKDMFVIEAIADSSNFSVNIIYAFGKLLKRMKEPGFWAHYAVAMPRNRYKELAEFEEGGFEALKIHIFLVLSFMNLTHLDPKETTDLLRGLKNGQNINPDFLSDF